MRKILSGSNDCAGPFGIVGSATFAGILIGIGCIVNLSTIGISPVVGAVLFGVGLMAVILQGLFLYTGKVGFLYSDKELSIKALLVGLIFNLIGVWTVCDLLCTPEMAAAAARIVETKASAPWHVAIVRSMVCGMMMFTAVQGYKESKSLLAVIFPVAVFILCGFDHCIANYGYMAMAGCGYVGNLPLWVIGNAVGALWLAECKSFEKFFCKN